MAQAATKQVEAQQIVRPENIKSTKLPNGLTISSVENYSPVSRFGVFVRAGSRHEPADQLGISHALRLAAGYSTRRSTIFGITRNIEYLGGNLTASTDRENLIYQLHNNRDHNEQTLQYLSDIVTRPAFKQWELEDLQYRFKTELDRLKLDPQAQLIEALHKAAFRGGLSNSLYSPDFNIGSHNSEKLHQYVQQTFQPDRTAIVGFGVDHEKLVKFVEGNFEYGAPLSVPEKPSKFIAGDARVPAKGKLAFAAVACEGPSLSNMKDVLAVAALQQLLGIGQRVKHSQGGNKLAIAAGKVAKQPFEVSTIFNQYSDSGLFGIYTATHGSEAHSVINAVVSELRNVIKGLTEADVNAAKYVDDF